MRPIALWKQLVVSLLLGGLALAGWQAADGVLPVSNAARAEGGSGGAGQGVPVIVAPVRTMRDDLVLEVVGTGRARRSVTLRSKASGEIVEMALAPNRRFEAGDVLMRLDDDKEQVALSLAETRLAEAERVLERFAGLRDSGTATLARLDEVETAAEIARLELARARHALSDRVLRAPFAGVSGLPALEQGAFAEANDAIASFDDRSAILVEFDLPEKAMARLGPNARVTATTPTAPGRRFEGEISAVDSRVDPASRTARVRVSLPNRDDALRPGASFTVRLELPGAVHPVVPELALQFSRGRMHVWRLAEDRVERVEVTMIRRRDGAVLVEGPLAEGDRVVVEGTQRLSPGRRVSVVESVEGGSS